MKTKQLSLSFIFVCYTFAFNAHASGLFINEKITIVEPTRPNLIEKSRKNKPLVKAKPTKFTIDGKGCDLPLAANTIMRFSKLSD